MLETPYKTLAECLLLELYWFQYKLNWNLHILVVVHGRALYFLQEM